MDPGETATLRRQLLGEFVAEGLEHLDEADAVLDMSEHSGLGAEARDGLMRAMHSIKGAAGYMELVDIQGLSHALETVAQQDIGADAEGALRFELLLAGTADLRDMVAHADAPRPASADLLTALREAGAQPAAPVERPRSSVADIFLDVVQQQCQALRTALRRLAPPGGPADALVEEPMVLRALASLRSSAAYAGRDDMLLLLDATLGSDGATSASVSADAIARLLDGIALIVGGAETEDAVGITLDVGPPASAQAANSTAPSVIDPFGTLRVPFARVDALIGQVGELLTVRNQLDHFLREVEATGCAPKLTRQGRFLAASVGRSVDDLQNTARELRLVRLETVFRRLPRICRDAAASTAKQARLELRGGDTELDKTVAEALADPLLHLLRNAVDHGIERPDERLAAGKPETGTVVVSARQDAAEIVIDVCDDGRGIDLTRIRKRAVESGLIDAVTAAELTPDDTLDLLFRPGFSTAASVTGISGRGVGLDVVRAKVIQLGGKVATRQLAPGTAFELRFPVRLAATDVVLVRAGGETFAVTLDGVHETLSIAADRVRRVGGRSAIVQQGRVVPLVSLAEVVGLGTGAVDGATGGELIVSEVNGQQVGLTVDEIGLHQQVVAKPLESYLSRPGVSAAAVLGDGRVVLVVSPGRLIASALTASAPAA